MVAKPLNGLRDVRAVPVIDDDGVVVWESMAFNLYLAKKHGGPLAPANVAEDGLMTMWALWAATEVEPHSIQVLYHVAANKPEARDPKIARASIDALRAPFAVLAAASVGLVAWLAFRLLGRPAALYAAFLLAISPALLMFGRMARVHAALLIGEMQVAVDREFGRGRGRSVDRRQQWPLGYADELGSRRGAVGDRPG